MRFFEDLLDLLIGCRDPNFTDCWDHPRRNIFFNPRSGMPTPEEEGQWDYINETRRTYFVRVMFLTVFGIVCFGVARDILNWKPADEPSWSWNNFWLLFGLSYLVFAAFMYYGMLFHEGYGLIASFTHPHGSIKEGAQTLGLLLLLCVTGVPLVAGFWALLLHWPYQFLKEVIVGS